MTGLPQDVGRAHRDTWADRFGHLFGRGTGARPDADAHAGPDDADPDERRSEGPSRRPADQTTADDAHRPGENRDHQDRDDREETRVPPGPRSAWDLDRQPQPGPPTSAPATTLVSWGGVEADASLTDLAADPGALLVLGQPTTVPQAQELARQVVAELAGQPTRVVVLAGVTDPDLLRAISEIVERRIFVGEHPDVRLVDEGARGSTLQTTDRGQRGRWGWVGNDGAVTWTGLEGLPVAPTEEGTGRWSSPLTLGQQVTVARDASAMTIASRVRELDHTRMAWLVPEPGTRIPTQVAQYVAQVGAHTVLALDDVLPDGTERWVAYSPIPNVAPFGGRWPQGTYARLAAMAPAATVEASGIAPLPRPETTAAEAYYSHLHGDVSSTLWGLPPDPGALLVLNAPRDLTDGLFLAGVRRRLDDLPDRAVVVAGVTDPRALLAFAEAVGRPVLVAEFGDVRMVDQRDAGTATLVSLSGDRTGRWGTVNPDGRIAWSQHRRLPVGLQLSGHRWSDVLRQPEQRQVRLRTGQDWSELIDELGTTAPSDTVWLLPDDGRRLPTEVRTEIAAESGRRVLTLDGVLPDGHEVWVATDPAGRATGEIMPRGTYVRLQHALADETIPVLDLGHAPSRDSDDTSTGHRSDDDDVSILSAPPPHQHTTGPLGSTDSLERARSAPPDLSHTAAPPATPAPPIVRFRDARVHPSLSALPDDPEAVIVATPLLTHRDLDTLVEQIEREQGDRPDRALVLAGVQSRRILVELARRTHRPVFAALTTNLQVVPATAPTLAGPTHAATGPMLVAIGTDAGRRTHAPWIRVRDDGTIERLPVRGMAVGVAHEPGSWSRELLHEPGTVLGYGPGTGEGALLDAARDAPDGPVVLLPPPAGHVLGPEVLGEYAQRLGRDVLTPAPGDAGGVWVRYRPDGTSLVHARDPGWTARLRASDHRTVYTANDRDRLIGTRGIAMGGDIARGARPRPAPELRAIDIESIETQMRELLPGNHDTVVVSVAHDAYANAMARDTAGGGHHHGVDELAQGILDQLPDDDTAILLDRTVPDDLRESLRDALDRDVVHPVDGRLEHLVPGWVEPVRYADLLGGRLDPHVRDLLPPDSGVIVVSVGADAVLDVELLADRIASLRPDDAPVVLDRPLAPGVARELADLTGRTIMFPDRPGLDAVVRPQVIGGSTNDVTFLRAGGIDAPDADAPGVTWWVAEPGEVPQQTPVRELSLGGAGQSNAWAYPLTTETTFVEADTSTPEGRQRLVSDVGEQLPWEIVVVPDPALVRPTPEGTIPLSTVLAAHPTRLLLVPTTDVGQPEGPWVWTLFAWSPQTRAAAPLTALTAHPDEMRTHYAAPHGDHPDAGQDGGAGAVTEGRIRYLRDTTDSDSDPDLGSQLDSELDSRSSLDSLPSEQVREIRRAVDEIWAQNPMPTFSNASDAAPESPDVSSDGSRRPSRAAFLSILRGALPRPEDVALARPSLEEGFEAIESAAAPVHGDAEEDEEDRPHLGPDALGVAAHRLGPIVATGPPTRPNPDDHKAREEREEREEREAGRPAVPRSALRPRTRPPGRTER